MLDDTDVIFISGGNTFFLLQEMRKSGFTELIPEYVKKGMTYVGSSAGSVVAGPDISLIKGLDDPKDAPELKDYAGLGLIDVLIFPHWGSANFQKRYMQSMNSVYGMGIKIILLTDDQYVVGNWGKYSIESI
jgi:dipeptidase E